MLWRSRPKFPPVGEKLPCGSTIVNSLSLLLLLLSLDAHNHLDDYSGALGGVRKVHISALVTSP